MAISVVEGEGSPAAVVKSKPTPAQGILGGLMMLAGGLLMLTLIGVVIGLPLAIAGVWVALKRGKALQAACPYCAQRVIIRLGIVGANCPACEKRVLVRNMRFYRVSA